MIGIAVNVYVTACDKAVEANRADARVPMRAGTYGGPTPVITHLLRLADGTPTRAEITARCAELAEALRDRDRGVVVCDVSAVTAPDLVTVEVLARLRLTARRLGWRLEVRGACAGLRELAGLLGLAGALLQPGGQPEQREQPVDVVEVVERRDPPPGDADHDQRPRHVT